MGQINLKTRHQRIAYMDSKFFLTSSEHYSQIGAEDIIEYSSENSGIPKAQMASAFYALSQQIRQFLLNGHTLELPNLGSLYLSVNAKAAETEEEAGAKAVTRISVKFRQCKKLRELINTNVHLVNMLTAKEDNPSNSQNGGGQQTGGNPSTGGSGQDGGSGNDNGGGNPSTGGSGQDGGSGNDNGGGDNVPGGDE